MSAEEETEDLGPLPPGRHGLSREQVLHNQRERIVAGFAAAVAAKGYNSVTIADITAAAGLSRRTYYEQFANKEECFLAALEIVVGHLEDLIAAAAQPIPEWPYKVRAGLGALLGFFAAEPQLARLCMVDSVTAGSPIADRYSEAILAFVPPLRAGREHRSAPIPLPETTEDSIVGSIAATVGRSVFAGEAERLEDLLPDLTAFALLPYLGPQEARRVAFGDPAS